MEQNPPAARGGPHAGADGCPKETVTPGKPTLEQAPGRTCGPMERGAHAGAGLLAGLVTLWEPTLEQFVKNCSLWEGLTLEKFMETVTHESDPALEQGKSVRSPPPEEEGVA